MTKLNNAPTLEFYEALQHAYDVFNHALFDNTLENSLITLQRKANTYGYMSYNRFASTTSSGSYVHELALNPEYFGIKPLIEIMQTMVHEQCHLWQKLHGTPSQKTYHNREWAEKMKSIGLMPSDTGRVGGRETGQHMGDYPAKDGKFMAVCNELFSRGYVVEWYDRYLPKKTTVESMIRDQNFAEMMVENNSDRLLAVPHLANISANTTAADIGTQNQNTVIHQEQSAKPMSSKQKFTCPACKNNLWGKPTLNVKCGDCDVSFELNDTRYESV